MPGPSRPLVAYSDSSSSDEKSEGRHGHGSADVEYEEPKRKRMKLSAMPVKQSLVSQPPVGAEPQSAAKLTRAASQSLLREASSPRPSHRPAKSLLSFATLCPPSTTNIPAAQRLQRAFIYLELPVCPALDRVLSQAARVTDEDAAGCSWVPPVQWLLRQRHHVSLTRPFSVSAIEAPFLPRLLEVFARRVSTLPLRFASFDHMADDWARMVYIAAVVDDSSRSGLAELARSIHGELASLLSVRPEMYYSENRFHVSFLAALLASASPNPSNDPPWQGGTPFDRAQAKLGNGDLLLRKTACLDASQGLYRGTMPPLPGVFRDQPESVVQAAQKTAGAALRALPPLRPASLCLRLGRQFFAFPLRETTQDPA